MYIVTDTNSLYLYIKSNIESIASNSNSFDEFVNRLAIFKNQIHWKLSESEFTNICFYSWDYLKSIDYLKSKSSNKNKNRNKIKTSKK